MLARNLSKLIPAIAVTGLLALAASAPQAPQMPAPNPQAAPCSTFSYTGGGNSLLVIGHGGAIRQPLPSGISMAACSLGVTSPYYWGGGLVTVMEWDPVALAPDPQSVALRTFYASPSSFEINAGVMPWLSFVPPLITRALAGVAEPPRATTAMQLREDPNTTSNDLTLTYDPDGPAAMPAASNVPGTVAPAFTGPHPVVAHEICDGGSDVSALRVAQSVRRTDAPISGQPDELAQRFNVPEPVELRWIELAVNSTMDFSSSVPPTIVGITDGVGDPAPPLGMPPSLVDAPLPVYYSLASFSSTPAPCWVANLDFDHTVTLYPGHDYWLYLQSAYPFTFLSRALTGSEPPEFTTAIGGFYTRSANTLPWTAVSGSVLAFKVVGIPTTSVSVPHDRVAFSLRVTPNPAQGVAEVVWSGAVGPVRFEVFDARGRRVATNEGGAAGTWRWSTRGARSEPLPSGVYFVHARDSAGGHSVQRLVIYR
jgi:hypothetical protein